MNEKELQVQISEAQPFLRYTSEKMNGNILNGDSDSASCSGSSDSGSGAASCAYVPEQPKI